MTETKDAYFRQPPEPLNKEPTEAQRTAFLDAAHRWYHFQSQMNVAELYRACSAYFGSDFNPAEYDSVP